MASVQNDELIVNSPTLPLIGLARSGSREDWRLVAWAAAPALLEHGLEVTALHNHFFWEERRVFFMHMHGHGRAVDLAKQIKL